MPILPEDLIQRTNQCKKCGGSGIITTLGFTQLYEDPCGECGVGDMEKGFGQWCMDLKNGLDPNARLRLADDGTDLPKDHDHNGTDSALVVPERNLKEGPMAGTDGVLTIRELGGHDYRKFSIDRTEYLRHIKNRATLEVQMDGLEQYSIESFQSWLKSAQALHLNYWYGRLVRIDYVESDEVVLLFDLVE